MSANKKDVQVPSPNLISKQEFDPYIGPRPFRRDPLDQLRFFGRDRETEEIISLIFSHRLVLVYAQSGTGKTSIFNAQVIPKLEHDYDFQVLPIARVQITSVTQNSLSSDGSSNLYINNAIQSITTDSMETHPQSIMNLDLFEYLDNHFPNNVDDNGEPRPQVLIFDQLEELFNLYPDNWIDQRNEFFQQIADSLENNPSLRIILIIREDYLAQLDPFKNILPENLRPSLRLQQLTRNQAILAIKGPLSNMIGNLNEGEKANIESEINELVNNLLKIKVEIPGGGSREVDGEFVEPIQLQVVCRRWWNETGNDAIKEGKKILNLGIINVDKALQDFYEEAISKASNKTGIFAGDIRTWCEKKLITSSGTRNLVHRESKLTSGLPNKVLEVLESNYLIRGGWISGAKWYELTHDRLIKPLTDSNIVWKKKFQVEVSHRTKLRKIRDASIVVIPIAIAILGIFLNLQLFPDYYNPYEIPVHYAPYDVLSVAWLDSTYVANSEDDTVSVINGSTDTVTKYIDVGKNPTNLALGYGNLIYVTNSGENTISVINGTTNTIFTKIGLTQKPSSITVGNYWLYVASAESGTVSVINYTTNELVQHIEVGKDITNMEFDFYNGRLYIGKSDNGTVSVVDGFKNSLLSPIKVGQKPIIIEPPEESPIVYVANIGNNTVSVINGTDNTLLENISINSTIIDVAHYRTNMYGFEPENLLALQFSTGDVYFINPKTKYIRPDYFKVGAKAYDMAFPYYSDTEFINKLYLSNPHDKTISVIDLDYPPSPMLHSTEIKIGLISAILVLVGLLLLIYRATRITTNRIKT